MELMDLGIGTVMASSKRGRVWIGWQIKVLLGLVIKNFVFIWDKKLTPSSVDEGVNHKITHLRRI